MKKSWTVFQYVKFWKKKLICCNQYDFPLYFYIIFHNRFSEAVPLTNEKGEGGGGEVS